MRSRLPHPLPPPFPWLLLPTPALGARPPDHGLPAGGGRRRWGRRSPTSPVPASPEDPGRAASAVPYLRGSGQQRRLKGARRQPAGDWQRRDDEQPEGERRPRSALHLGQAGGGRLALGAVRGRLGGEGQAGPRGGAFTRGGDWRGGAGAGRRWGGTRKAPRAAEV